MKKSLLSTFLITLMILIGINKSASGQTVIASWSFDALLAPTADVPTAKIIAADFGPLMANANAYLDGSNGASDWASVTTNPELTAFSGNVLNDPRTTTNAGMALALANLSANGKYVVFKFSTTGYSNIGISLATRGTSTGFATHNWAWSIDNVTYTDFATTAANKTSTWSVEDYNLTSIPDLNNATTVYIRLKVEGATNATGNNRIDNFVVYSDVTAPVATIAPADAATDVAINTVPTITFNEPIKKTDGSEVTDADLTTLVKFKKTNSTGEDVACTMTIDAAKKVITITPTANLDNSQAYYIECGEVEDAAGNTGVVTTSTFTTIAATTPSLTITAPTTGASYYAGDDVTITWTSANITNVSIDVYESGTLVANLTTSTAAAAGTFALTIPADADYSAAYTIKISDADNASFFVDSDPFTIIGVATSISDLRSRFAVTDVVKLSSEAVITFIQGKNYYAQDAGAGILIYDTNTKLTTVYAQYDGIKGVTGTLTDYNGVLELVPTADAGAAFSTGNTVVPLEVNAVSLNSDIDTYESRLVKILDMTFADAGGTFAKGVNYNITDGTTTTIFRTAFTSDITGTTIPKKADIVGLAMEYKGTSQIASRSLADLTIYSPEKAITAFAFNGLTPAVNATIDESAKTIAATVPAGTDLTALVPTITISAKATVSPASGSTVNFTSPVVFTVTAEDGTTQAYTVTVSLGTGIDDDPQANVTVYPVPATVELKINNIGSVKYFEVFNAAGVKIETVRTDGVSFYPMPVASYKPGLYFIRFTTENGVFMKKFMKR